MTTALAQDDLIRRARKTSDTQSGLYNVGSLSDGDQFGSSITHIGARIDRFFDLAVGARVTDGQGVVWMVLSPTDLAQGASFKVGEGQGGFEGDLDEGDRFGSSLAHFFLNSRFDFYDLAVGATHDDDGGNNRGAVWLLFLKNDATVDSHQKISDTAGGFRGRPRQQRLFRSQYPRVGGLE